MSRICLCSGHISMESVPDPCSILSPSHLMSQDSELCCIRLPAFRKKLSLHCSSGCGPVGFFTLGALPRTISDMVTKTEMNIFPVVHAISHQLATCIRSIVVSHYCKKIGTIPLFYMDILIHNLKVFDMCLSFDALVTRHKRQWTCLDEY